MTKFIASILFALSLILWIVSLNNGIFNTKHTNSFKNGRTIGVWVDKDTGCQYHFWQNGADTDSNFSMTLSPKIGRDGKPICEPL